MIEGLLGPAVEQLRRAGIPSPRFEAELLLADLLGVDRLMLRGRSIEERLADTGLAAATAANFAERVRRRATGEPLAHITGRKEFYGRVFRVNADVLVPRPETELLVDELLNPSDAREPLPIGARVLDLCCGSGCIGLSLLAERPDLDLSLSDVSPAALAVARENLQALFASGEQQSRCRFLESDLYANLPDTQFDAIACNPPYIHPDERAGLGPGVANFDPALALFHDDPPALYREILIESYKRLVFGGAVVLELGSRWAAELLDFAGEVYEYARIRKDYAGIDRVLIAGRGWDRHAQGL